jgi:hypothetical protein
LRVHRHHRECPIGTTQPRPVCTYLLLGSITTVKHLVTYLFQAFQSAAMRNSHITSPAHTAATACHPRPAYNLCPRLTRLSKSPFENRDLYEQRLGVDCGFVESPPLPNLCSNTVRRGPLAEIAFPTNHQVCTPPIVSPLSPPLMSDCYDGPAMCISRGHVSCACTCLQCCC